MTDKTSYLTSRTILLGAAVREGRSIVIRSM